MKPVRKAVRTFLFQGDKVMAIRYKNGNQKGYLDIPGGMIEDGETSEEAAVREFREETGITISDIKSVGRLVVEYLDRVFDFELLVGNFYQGEAGNFLENDSMWYLISDAIHCEKIFPSVKLLDFLPLSNISLKFLCNEVHEVLSVSNL